MVLPLHICSHWFFVARLQAQERPTLATCALSDLWEVRAQNQVLSERARNGVLETI